MKELTCKECKGVRMVCWINKIHKHFKVTMQNNEVHQMPISLLMVDIQKTSHMIIIFIKVILYIQTSALQKSEIKLFYRKFKFMRNHQAFIILETRINQVKLLFWLSQGAVLFCLCLLLLVFNP